MDKLLIMPSPQRIQEASRAIRRGWSYDERRARRRTSLRRQLELVRALPVTRHPERSEASQTRPHQVLRCAPNDR